MESLKAALHPLIEHDLPQEAKLCAAGQSIVGMSPSTSLKRDRLMHRNAILRRTGFLEGTSIKGSIAGAPVCLLLSASALSYHIHVTHSKLVNILNFTGVMHWPLVQFTQDA